MKSEYDAIIVGAGPAGSTCATLLAKKDRNVLLLEKSKFPRDKICGDGISGKSVAILNEIGLIEEINSSDHVKVSGVVITSPKGTRVEIEVPIDENLPPAYICRRYIFDNILFEKARSFSNVDVLQGFEVTDIIKEDSYVVGVRGLDSNGEERVFKGKIVVGADGALSVLRQKLSNINGIDKRHTIIAIRAYYKNVVGTKNKYEFHIIKTLMPGYFWIFPLENNLSNVGLAIEMKDKENKNLNLKEVFFDIVNNNPMFKERFRNAELLDDIKGWTLPLGSKTTKSYGNGFLLIGDAAALIDPLTGEGIGNAMWSAQLAAKTIDRALEIGNFSEETLRTYEEYLKLELRKELSTTYFFQRLLNHESIINFILKKAAKRPGTIERLMELSKVGPKFPRFHLTVLKILLT